MWVIIIANLERNSDLNVRVAAITFKRIIDKKTDEILGFTFGKRTNEVWKLLLEDLPTRRQAGLERSSQKT